jgi:hypothetical protein
VLTKCRGFRRVFEIAVGLGLTLPITEIGATDLPWGVEVAGASGLYIPIVWESWEPKPPGALGAYLDMHRVIFIFYLGLWISGLLL